MKESYKEQSAIDFGHKPFAGSSDTPGVESMRGGTTFKMKMILAFVLIATFSLGFWSAFPFQWVFISMRSDWELKQYRESVQKAQGKFYGKYTFHSPGVDPAADALLAGFEPSTSKCSITLTTEGGFPPFKGILQLTGDGSLYSERDHGRKLITQLDPAECKAFFHRVLTSGILNFSEDVVAVKEDVLPLRTKLSVDDAVDVTILVLIPEMGVDKSAFWDGGKAELRNFPEIVELKSFNAVEKAMFGLVPSGYPLWR